MPGLVQDALRARRRRGRGAAERVEPFGGGMTAMPTQGLLPGGHLLTASACTEAELREPRLSDARGTQSQPLPAHGWGRFAGATTAGRPEGLLQLDCNSRRQCEVGGAQEHLRPSCARNHARYALPHGGPAAPVGRLAHSGGGGVTCASLPRSIPATWQPDPPSVWNRLQHISRQGAGTCTGRLGQQGEVGEGGRHVRAAPAFEERCGNLGAAHTMRDAGLWGTDRYGHKA